MEPLLQCAPWPARCVVRVALLAAAAVEDMRPAIDGYLDWILSSEWPENFSLLTYANLCAYLGVPNRHPLGSHVLGTPFSPLGLMDLV
jgi:hypothetical protein